MGCIILLSAFNGFPTLVHTQGEETSDLGQVFTLNTQIKFSPIIPFEVVMVPNL